ncbi:MAG: hypothetical protein ACRD1K_09035 [Acidimicrobiales bacterium]
MTVDPSRLLTLLARQELALRHSFSMVIRYEPHLAELRAAARPLEEAGRLRYQEGGRLGLVDEGPIKGVPPLAEESGTSSEIDGFAVGRIATAADHVDLRVRRTSPSGSVVGQGIAARRAGRRRRCGGR